MKIINLMLGKGKGGLEQVAADYHAALSAQGIDVLSITHPHAWINDHFPKDASLKHLAPLGEWDRLAAWKLRRIAKHEQADAIICHGNRAIGLALKACKKRIPVIGVAHNYKIKKRFPKCDSIFCITRDLIEEMVHMDIARDTLFHIPNMLEVDEMPERSNFRDPPVFGTLGRFVEKKGFDIFLHALKVLHDQNIPFRAMVGGDGPMATRLTQMAKEFGIEDKVHFTGWVKDKNQFFSDLDVFVLPSHHEPFGIVLIEAMRAGLPCITTDTEGPCEIIKHNHDAIMIDKAKPFELAQAIIELIDDQDAAKEMGEHAYEKVKERYAMPVVGATLKHALESVIKNIR